MKPKLRIIMPDEPDEFGKGYQKLVYHRIFELRKHYELILVCIKPVNRLLSNEYKKEAKDTTIININIGFLEVLINIIICILNLRPLQTALYTSPLTRQRLRRNSFDINIFYLSRTYVDLGEDAGLQLIEFVDSMHKNFKSRVSHASWLKRFVYRYEAARSLHFERAISQKVDLCTAVSADDAKHISDRIEISPIGVDDIMSKHTVKPQNYITISGKMDYEPNITAALWFYHNVWKNRPASLLHYKYKILGSKPTAELKLLMVNDPSVIVTGHVASLTAELSKSRVSVAPMQSGSGMQFKILEAMAAGVPVITTLDGLGDIKAIPGKEILLADTPQRFSKLLTKLIQDTNYSEYYSNRGRHFVIQNHTWDALNRNFVHKIEKLRAKENSD